MTDEQIKQCITCKEVKPLESFPSRPSLPDGREGECNSCRSLRRKTGDGYLKERLRKHYYRSGGKGDLTLEQLREIESQKRCTYCGCVLYDEIRMVDHVYSLGQLWSLNCAINMVACCRSCNSSKRDSHVYDFYQRSDKFTTAQWEEFVYKFARRAMRCEPSKEELEQWSIGFELEAKELKEYLQRA
ncbi:HNH endonuclease signature motif containing protein [Rummeliibacillus sp. TYF-LIM-RU47]|uniref:HNH endonuclease signature motif containing protein n=1 Tax=Rummeliibacillus sp. TYF-LIM-RU47 TaxID=2608406 RepID=UPI00123AE390|nr:HNH endonuclease signature motif containing protein [Rummeliibacillus sp. TYF-LIM-RU47]